MKSGQWIPIRIRNLDLDSEGQNEPTKLKKFKKFHVLKCGCSLLRAEGFSCSLDVLYGGLGIS